jgi:hypothetical protein
MKVTCKECKKEFDDKYHNIRGFNEILLIHSKQHENEGLIQKYFKLSESIRYNTVNLKCDVVKLGDDYWCHTHQKFSFDSNKGGCEV